MDSRDYICAFTIGSLPDVPADFGVREELSNLAAGLFLPQSDPDWLGRRAYPARILLLTPDSLRVVPHPSSNARGASVPLRELDVLECGRILLLGWIRLRWDGNEQTLRYNRRTALPVERFLARLKTCWLRPESGLHPPVGNDYPPALTDKFKYALATEMIDDERTVACFFRPATRRTRRRFLARETWSAGDLLLLTNRRVLWITDRREAAYEPHGTISRSAPLAALVEIRDRLSCRESRLEIVLSSGGIWHVPIGESWLRGAAIFAKMVCAGVFPSLRSGS